VIRAWALPLRIARRDALKHRGRSVLTLVMIALPVLAVTAADVSMQTADLSSRESLDRRIGASAALIQVNDGISRVEQGPDPDDQPGLSEGDDGYVAASADEVSSLLGGARLVDLHRSESTVATDQGRGQAELTELDLRDPAVEGLYDLTSGRLPESDHEVVVNQAMADKGYAVGDTLDLTADDAPADPTIVGIAESTYVRSFPVAAGPVGSLLPPETESATWLVDGGPVSWSTVRQLNDIGATVTSRAVIEDPPPTSQWPESARPYGGGLDDTTVAVLVLIVVMALIEVVLLAGPSFAVGARKQQRDLALLVATGGTPVQARRVVIGSAIVLGSVAAVVGVVLGIGLSVVLRPVLQRFSTTWLGPLDVPWLHLLGVAAFGLLSAFLAALFPAWLASRQDVVAVLAGRRGDRAPSLRSPVLGAVLVAAGVVGSVVGATGGTEILIAASAIPAVLGMVLLVPVVLAGLARVSGRLPLVLRYAVRDAARHRTRTVPAVSAVAATVAGVVALGIGLTSDDAENRETYAAALPAGVGMVTTYSADLDFDTVRAMVAPRVPDATLTEQRGVGEYYADGDTESSYTQVYLDPDGQLLANSSGVLGASVMVSDDRLPIGLIGLDATQVEAADAALRAGRAVVFHNGAAPAADTVTVDRDRYDPTDGTDLGSQTAQAPATWVRVPIDWRGPNAVVPTAVAESVGASPVVVGLAITGPTMTDAQQTAVTEGVTALSDSTSVYVERGYQADSFTVIAQLILVGLGGALMLGGTLTATFLALSDARPDLATLSAVGASPRTRRGVAAAYAVVVGLVGAVLGAAVGFVPGLAVVWPLTRTPADSCIGNNGGTTTCPGVAVGPFVDVPWLMVLALVVALPLVAALVVGLFSRSRLPLVARLD
jgi:putative ABC transport system permease protein